MKTHISKICWLFLSAAVWLITFDWSSTHDRFWGRWGWGWEASVKELKFVKTHFKILLYHQLFVYLWCPPSEENISETRLPASDIVSLSKFIIGESFMETHSRPLEAVGLHDRLKGCESENRPRRRSPYSKSTDFERFKTSTICKKISNNKCNYHKETFRYHILVIKLCNL